MASAPPAGPWEDFAHPSAAPVPASGAASGGPWEDFAPQQGKAPTAEEAAKLYAFATHAKTPHELEEYALSLRPDRSLAINNAADILKYRDKNGGVVSHTVNFDGGSVASPDTSFSHDLGVAGKGALYGLTDAGSFANKIVLGPLGQIMDMAGLPDPAKPVYGAIDHIHGGSPQTGGQHYLQATVRGVTAAAPFAAAGPLAAAVPTLVSGGTSAVAGEAARQAGYGPGVQFAASAVGGLAGGTATARAVGLRGAPPVPEEMPTAVPPTPRGPMAAIARLTGADRTVGARLVAQRIADDGMNPYDAGRAISEAQANGTPASLADLGENTRALAASVARQPGPARTIGKEFTKDRQMGQMDRVRDAINRDLGPTTDVLAESERLIGQARATAAPLYDQAHPQVIHSPRLDTILATPAGKDALQRARTIAANEGVSLDDGAAQGGLSTRTLDYVKRGLDDIVENYRDKTTGKLQLDEYGRSVNGVKARLLGEMDRLNPDYAAARQAYAGPAALRTAMMDGKGAINKSASEINQRIKNMTPAEAEQYGLGYRSALANMLEGSPDGANKVRALIGNPKRRAALQLVFGGRANLDRFVATLENEHRAFETYSAIHSGSPTQPRAMEDAANSDVNLLRGVGGDLAAVGQGPIGIGLRALERGGDLLRFGAGNAGKRAREDAAALLFSTSPTEFNETLGKITLKSRGEVYRRQLRLRAMGGGVAAAVGQYGSQKP